MIKIEKLLLIKLLIRKFQMLSKLMEKLVSAGRLGKKTGMGIYDWSSGEAEECQLPE